jgi:hypothetical protein
MRHVEHKQAVTDSAATGTSKQIIVLHSRINEESSCPGYYDGEDEINFSITLRSEAARSSETLTLT